MCIGHPRPRRPTGAYQHAAARHRASSPPKHRLSMDSGQTLAGLCVYEMKRADPGPAPAELLVGGRGRHAPGNHSSGQRALGQGRRWALRHARRKVSGEPGNNRAASLHVVCPQPSAPWGVTRAPCRSTSMGSKARLHGRGPRPPLSLTHGTVQINRPGVHASPGSKGHVQTLGLPFCVLQTPTRVGMQARA